MISLTYRCVCCDLELFEEAWSEQHPGHRGGEYDQGRRASASLHQP